MRINRRFVSSMLASLTPLLSYADAGTAARLLPAGAFMKVVCVAPNGNDSAAGTTNAPLATLERARDMVREINTKMTGDILVAVAPGDYFLTKPFTLTPEDSGRDGFTVRYQGLGKPGSARLLGGNPVARWEPVDGVIFRARTNPGHHVQTLYENGLRARKARFPNYEFDARFPLSGARYLNAKAGTDTQLTWSKGDLDPIRDVPFGSEANLVFWPWGYAAWQKVTRQIETIDFSNQTLTVPSHVKCPAIGKQARFYVEGAKGLLDQPGEFYLDTKDGYLYYWPRFGNPNIQEIIAPELTRMIDIEGESANNPVHHIAIEGFSLNFTDTFPTMTGPTLFPWAVETGYGSHGVLHLRYTENINLRFNHIKGAGLTGIYFDRSNKRNTIYGNWIEDAGISGICLAYHRTRQQFPDDINAFNTIENNLIHGLGSIAVDSAGINIWGGNDNTVAHCEIFDGARYGISIRGPFVQGSYADTGRPLTANNSICNSLFYRLGQDSGDMGAIHMAAISTPSVRPVNTLEQLLIFDIAAHPSMNDVKPNGIFFDYPAGVTDQVLRDIEIRAVKIPFRTNKTDVRHTYDNCSWRDGFDTTRMHYDQIGLTADFPKNFRSPGEVAEVSIRATRSNEKRVLEISWTNPADIDLKGVWITTEGMANTRPVFIPTGREKISIPYPTSTRLVDLRLQTEDASGNRSPGILIPAAERPQSVADLSADGVDTGIDIRWNMPNQTIGGFRISIEDPNIPAVTVGADARNVRLKGLENAKIYAVRVDVIDVDGHAWPGPDIHAASGKGVPIPQDAAAWWTFDEPVIREGLSIGDASGNGNTLFIGNDKAERSIGKFDTALHFDGETAFARVLAPEPLSIGTGSYAISVWIRQAATSNFTERFLDFGGSSSHPGICLMANNQDVRLIFNDGVKSYSPYYRGLSMVGNWMHVVVNVDRKKELSLYVNGEKLVSEDISLSAERNIPAAQEFFLGRYVSSSPQYNWSGDMDQLRIYKRALRPEEIMALYQER
ncbi:MAG: LamG-like jellyroll fold domain-containing protein [Kiritimatiellales bacterium]